LLDAIVQQSREARTQLEAVTVQRQEASKEIETLRQQSNEAHAGILREAQAAREAHQYLLRQTQEGAEQVNLAASSAMGHLVEASRQFAETRKEFFRGFEEEVGGVKKHLGEVRQSFQELPRQVDDFRQRLSDSRAQVQALDESTRVMRQNREELEQETRQAQIRLEAVRQEAAEAERRLTPLRTEAAEAERRLAALRTELDEVERKLEEKRHVTVSQAPAVVSSSAEQEARNRLGVKVDPGVLVADVLPGTVAAAAGLVRGDIIYSVNGETVLTGADLRELIEEEENKEAIFEVMRNGVMTEVKVHLVSEGDEAAAEGRSRLGVTVDPGVVVAEVLPGTPAASAGVVPGDVINTINGEVVSTGPDLRESVEALDDHAEVTLNVIRDGEEREVRTQLDEAVPAS